MKVAEWSLKFLLYLLFFLIVPMLIIWAVNVLFDAGIAMSFRTVGAVWILLIMRNFKINIDLGRMHKPRMHKPESGQAASGKNQQS